MIVLVMGATGKQGGAVARRLLSRGHTVRAATRKPDSPAARELAKAGADLVQCNLLERASVDRAVEGVSAVFAMSTPFEAGMDAETKQGVTVVDAAKAAGAYLVYSSVASAQRHTGIPHFDSKYEVERHIEKVGANASIIGPAYFMENVYFTREQLDQGVYATPLSPGRKLAQVAVADIASFAVMALEHPERFARQRHDIAGDELSGAEAADVLSRVTGRKFSYYQVPMEAIRQRMGEDGAKMYEWFERTGYHVDVAGLRREFPEVGWHSFEAWAKEQPFAKK